MEEVRGAKLNEIIKQLGLNEGSPDANKSQKLVNIHRINARGKGLKFVPVKRPVTFALRAPGFDQDDITIIVTAPSGREVPTRIDTLRPGAYEVEYITPEVGDHIIEVLACGQAITGSPFHSSGYDASKIKVAPMPSGVVGKAVEFEIDGSEGGSGNLEILVNGGHVTSEVKCLGNHRFVASFVPHAATTHIVEMKFNDDSVPGSPWTCNVSNPDSLPPLKGSLRVHTLDTFCVGQTQFFDVIAVGHSQNDLSVKIMGPLKTSIAHRIVDLQNNSYRVYFSAPNVGPYSFEVSIPSEPNSRHNFIAKAYDVSRIHVSNVPKNVLLNETCSFQVDASQAGEGQLEIAVNDGDVPNQVQVQGNGRCQVSFKPDVCAPHVVDIKFNGQNVPSCPFSVEVSDSSQFSFDLTQLELIAVGRVCKFRIESKNSVEADAMRVVITSPTGKQVPVNLFFRDSGISCEFQAIEVGPHVMTIEYKGRSITSNPLFIKTYDSQKVLVTPATFGYVGKSMQFVVDASSSGEGNLEIAVNAKGINVMTQVHPMGGAKFGVSFTPSEVCDHVVFVTFNNEPVPGSPFTVCVGADVENISVSGTALNFCPVDQTAVITIHNIRNDRDLKVKVEGPSGQVLPVSLKSDAKSGPNVYLSFIPRDAGEHLIHLVFNGMPLSGSPFKTKVYNIKEICVKEMPKEIVVGKPVTFLVEAANAGPGNLEVIVNNGKVPSCPQALGPSLYAISFVPKDPETHLIEIRFNGEAIHGSPFPCNVIDASKMIIRRESLDRIPVDKESSFVVDTRGASFFDHSISILGPGNRAVAPTVTGDSSSGFKVSFTPSEVGDHLIDVKVAGDSIPPCPFMAKVYDANNVKISDINTGTVSKPVFFTIDASQAGAGNLEIIVSVHGRNVPNYVQSEGNAKFRVNFKPTEASVHTISVKFNGEAVPGSPYMVNVTDGSQTVMSAQSLRMASVSRRVEFNVENKSGVEECKAVVTTPSGKKIKPTVTSTAGFFTLSFLPTEVGPHQIIVLMDGSTLPGSPIACNVYDVSKVKVAGLTGGTVGKAVTFQVDASQAGEGTLELVVTTKKTSVRAEVLMRSRGLYDVTFIPTEKVTHFLNIQFNEEDVPGSPFSIEVKEPSATTNGTLSRKSTNKDGKIVTGIVGSPNVSSFEWPLKEREPSNIDVRVLGPAGNIIPATASLDGNNLNIEYTPKEVGLHRLEVLYDKSPVTKTPFMIEVCDPSRVKLVNVQDGVVGRELNFRVDSSRAGRGDLSIGIKVGDKPLLPVVKELASGIYSVTFIPPIDRPHAIDVRFNGYAVPSCPLLLEIKDPKQSIIVHGSGLKHCTPRKVTNFLIETGGFASAKDFDVIITDPQGSPLAVKCFQQKDASLLAEFTPTRVGSHKIDVLYLEAHVSGSPFISEAFDASKVFLQKMKSNNFAVNENIRLSLNRKDAGFAELDVTVTSPLGRHLPIKVLGTEDNEGEIIEFVPTAVGKYKIGITFGGIEIPGSPMTFSVTEGTFPRIEGHGLKSGLVNELCKFHIDARGLHGSPKVKVESPETQPKVSLHEENGVYLVTFLPTEVGVYDVHVTWNDREAPGSPFHPQIVDVSRVRPIGGWDNLLGQDSKIMLTREEDRKISFDCQGAGSGKLRASVKSPDGVSRELPVEQTSPHKFRISFSSNQEGDHSMSIYFADQLLPLCPLKFSIPSPPSSDNTTVVLRGHGLAGARVGEETEFIIDGGDAAGHVGQPDISLTGVKADIPIVVTQVNSRVFKVTYTASIAGTYLLNVLWAGKQVKGCPLKVSILPRCDAARVSASGEGLKGGSVDKDLKIFIDTKRAGPGELSAHCMGPQKVVQSELIDQMNGTFFLIIKPQEPGKHVLTIKYGGEHIPGSPFPIRVSGPPDPSKVRIYGPGIEHGVLPLYQSRFICDTRGAGAGQLTVRIRGPKGAFRVEMQRESQKDRTILCKYDPTEPGDYRIEVKWSGQHVPGSPFPVMIFDTQDELNRFLMTQSRHQSLRSPSDSISDRDHFFSGSSMQFGSCYGPVSWRGSCTEVYGKH